MSNRARREKKNRFVVARVEDLPDGERMIVEVNGRSVGLFNVGGEYHALLNRCPHQNGPLCLGDVLNLVEASKPGDYRFDAETKVISCPWHGWEFDLRTGQSYFDPARTRVKSYRVDVASGRALCGSAEAATSPSSGPQRGPYVAQVIPVTVEDEYLVLTMGS